MSAHAVDRKDDRQLRVRFRNLKKTKALRAIAGVGGLRMIVTAREEISC
jgi:hypothetical protein